jgi:predicted peptidase
MKKLLSVLAVISVLTACQATNVSETDAPSTQPIVWDKQYGGVDKAYDTHLLALRDKIAPRFQVFEFTDEKTGKTLAYNLYVPKNLDPNKKYPLVMFIADASTAGKGVQAPLMQGYGGIIWATDESQAKNPAFVLVPAFSEKAVDDEWHTSDEVALVLPLLKQTLQNYPIDDKRIYTTGQSMGGMISFYLNSIEPNFFAASMFVGSQWDINVLTPLTQSKFIYTVSAGDPKASAGMSEVITLMKQYGVSYGEAEFSAKLSQEQQNKLVNTLLSQAKSINFIRFETGSVLPTQGTTMKMGEHMYSFDYAYLLEPAREWLFAQSK